MNKVKWMAFAFPKSYFLSLGLFLPGKFPFRQQQFEPIPDSDYQEVLSITWGGAEGRLSIVFMPKQNRTGLKRLTSSSYRAVIYEPTDGNSI